MVNKNVKMGLNGVTLLVGLYLVFTNWGAVTTPLLSGVAFVSIAVSHCELLK